MKIHFKFLILLFLGSSYLNAQNINWSGLMKDNAGNALASTNVTLTFSVLEGPAETLLYRETHAVTTGSTGLLSAEIGGGTVNAGVFANLDFTKPYKLRTEANSGNGNVTLGVTEFKAVPLAKSANSAESAKSAEKVQKGTSSIEIDNGNQILIKENGATSLRVQNGKVVIPDLAGPEYAVLRVSSNGTLERKIHYPNNDVSISSAQVIPPGFKYEVATGLYNDTGDTNTKFYVGLNLPQGTFSSMTMEFLDNTPVSGITVRLWAIGREPSKSTERKVIASVSSAQTFLNPNWSSITTQITNPLDTTILNYYYSYVLEISASNGWTRGSDKLALNKILINYDTNP